MDIKKWVFGVFLTAVMAGCGGSESGPNEITSFSHLQSISFESDRYSIIVGNTLAVSVSEGAGSGDISYETSDASVASVSSDGLISAHSVGEVTITATKAADSLYASASDTAEVTVTPKLEQTIAFESANIDLIITNDLQLQIVGGEGSGAIIFESSDPGIASVSSSGVVSAIGLGSVTITATKVADATFAAATASITITVVPKLAQSISFAADSYTVVVGNSQTITASGGPGIGEIFYSSSDPTIATVTNAGLVTGLQVGSVTITAQRVADSSYAEATTTTTVNVSDLLEQTIDFEFEAYQLVLDQTITVLAAGGEGVGSISYSSSDESVVTITQAGLISGVGVGVATISAVKAADQTYAEAFTTATVTVTPKAPDAPVIDVLWRGNERFTINWSPVDGATSYNIYSAKESIEALNSLDNLESLDGSMRLEDVNSPKTVTALSNNTNYFVVVTALEGDSESPISNQLVVMPTNPLNDTGITVSGGGTSGINATCTPAIQNEGHVPQDCDQGRDAVVDISASKVGFGAAAFDFTKLGSEGSPLNEQDVGWSATGNEIEGSRWACIRDNVTGLVWEVKTTEGVSSVDNKFTWQNRDQHVDTVNADALCGITSWRVPSLTELLTIAYNGRSNPAADLQRFPNAKSQSYWTSDGVSGVPDNAWTVNFFSGIGNSKTKASTFQVRLVAGNHQASQFEASRFVDNADGTLTDLVTGLMWKRCPEGLSGPDCSQGAASKKVWGVAMKTARDSTYAGYDDWRLPNMKEMQTLVDVARDNPAQDQSVFPNPNLVLNYWTSSLVKKQSPVTQSWRVNFQYGLSEVKVRTQSLNAQWLVRDAE